MSVKRAPYSILLDMSATAYDPTYSWDSTELKGRWRAYHRSILTGGNNANTARDQRNDCFVHARGSGANP